MKRTIIPIFLALVLLAPSFTRAQTLTPEDKADIITQLETELRALLLQEIAVLQQQLTDLQAQQATQTTTLGSVQTQVDKLSQNGIIAPMPTPQPSATITAPAITLQPQMRDKDILLEEWSGDHPAKYMKAQTYHIPVTITGNYAAVSLQVTNSTGNKSTNLFKNGENIEFDALTPNGQYTYSVKVYSQPWQDKIGVGSIFNESTLVAQDSGTFTIPPDTN